MNRIAPTVTLAILCGACSSTRSGQYGTELEFNANCRVRDQEISIEVQTNGKPITELELVLQDGTVLHPEVVRGPRGKEIALGMLSDDPDAGLMLDTHKQPAKIFATFPTAHGDSGPRELVLTPAKGGESSILLAEVEGQKVDSRFAAFGYTRELRTFPDGTEEIIYVRKKLDGSRHEVSRADFESAVSSSIKQIYSALPDTAKEISDTPAVTQFLAGIFEQGFAYGGDLSSNEAASGMTGEGFSSKQVRVVHYDDQGHELKNEDPLSTITRFLVDAINASNAEELEAIRDRARNGECDESQYVIAEATLKARGLKQAMDILRENTTGLSVSDWKAKKYGHYFNLYLGWILEAEANSDSEELTISRLTRIVLNSLTRKGLSRGEKPISYRMKLQREFALLSSEFSE